MLKIGVGQTLFACFDAGGVEGIHTQNVNGSTVVIIISPYAAGLTHFSLYSDAIEGNADATMRRFREVHRSHANYFPPDRQIAYVIHGMHGGETVLPAQKDIIQQHLRDMGIVTIPIPYDVTSWIRPGDTICRPVIILWKGRTPKIFVGQRYVGTTLRRDA